MIETEITFLTKTEGGRDIPDGMFQGFRYRPHIVIGDPMQRQAIAADGNRLTEDYLGVAFSDGPDHIELGQPAITRMVLVYWPRVDYSAAVPGATFTLREGGHIIAHGRIAKRWTEN